MSYESLHRLGCKASYEAWYKERYPDYALLVYSDRYEAWRGLYKLIFGENDEDDHKWESYVAFYKENFPNAAQHPLDDIDAICLYCAGYDSGKHTPPTSHNPVPREKS